MSHPTHFREAAYTGLRVQKHVCLRLTASKSSNSCPLGLMSISLPSYINRSTRVEQAFHRSKTFVSQEWKNRSTEVKRYTRKAGVISFPVNNYPSTGIAQPI